LGIEIREERNFNKMQSKKQNDQVLTGKTKEPPRLIVEKIVEKRLEELVTFLSAADGRKSKLYEEVMTIVEKGLFKIALRRCNNVKSTAATFLGINRNTFTDKMTRLSINCEKNKNVE
jgi:DNA-binding protein Fis